MKTQSSTIASAISELFEAHMEKCDVPLMEVPHIISEVNKTKAMIESIGTASDLRANRSEVILRLDDGSDFLITVEPVPIKKWTVFAYVDGDYGVHPMVLQVEGKNIAEAWDAALEKAKEDEVGTIPAHGGKELRSSDLENMTEVTTLPGWLL